MHALAVALSCSVLGAQTLQQTVVATQLDSPVALAVAADGRLFVTQQGGAVRVLVDDVLLPTPFVVLPTAADDEEGLTGIALDPAFALNGYVYLRVTASTPQRHNQIVRVTANGNTAVPGSATTLFDLDPNQAHFHLGSGLHFAPDGTLYFATGDNDTPFFAGNLGSLHGKMLRLRADGTIPTDNPYYGTASGNGRAIFAFGLRNPFAFAIDAGSGRILANDVGSSLFEEIDDIAAGANYGWPGSEGPSAVNVPPVYAYGHTGPGGGCAITGGCFYRATTPQLPPQYLGQYLFAEYCRGEIRSFDPAQPGSAAVLLNTITPGPVDLAAAPDGALYCLCRGSIASSGGTGLRFGSVIKVTAAGTWVPTFTTFGFGCAGALGVPYLRATSAPRLGATAFAVQLGNALPFAAGALQLGASNTTWAFGSLPVDLTPLGLDGCRLLTSPDDTKIAFNGAGNELSFPLPIPNLPALLGVPIYLQGGALDTAANAFGAVLTPGTTARIGV